MPKSQGGAALDAARTAKRAPMSSIPISSSDFLPLEAAQAACNGCGAAESLGFQFSYAYQPIVDVRRREI